MEEEPTVIITNVKTTLVFNVFTCNMVFSLGLIFLAAIPYYDYFGLSITREGLLIFGVSAVLLYAALIVVLLQFNHLYASVVVCGLWWLCLSFFVGFLSASFYNITPIQCFLISWVQSLCMVLYARLSPAKMEWYISASFMMAGSALVWAASVYSYIVENDWFYSIGVLVFAVLLVVYNTWQIEHIKERFDLSWEQSIRACLFYYCPFL
jgi:hypothetical protein